MSSTPSVTLAAYTSLLRRRWRAVLVGVLIGAIVGAGMMVLLPRRYVAGCDVLVLPIRSSGNATTDPRSLDAAINLDTEAQIVRSVEVANAARKELRSSQPATELSDLVRVSAPPNTTILKIEFPGTSPGAAARGARAFAETYLANRLTNANALIEKRKAGLEASIESYRELLQAETAAATSSQDNADRTFARARQTVLVKQLNLLSGQLRRLSTTAVDIGRIIRTPESSATLESPLPKLIVPSCVMAGLLVGLFLAGIRDRLDRRVRSERDLLTALPLFGVVDAVGRTWEGMTVAGKTAEQYRRLTNRTMRALETNPDLHVILVLPIDTEAGVFAARLAIAAAQSGRSTCLIPTEQSKPAVNATLAAAGMTKLVADLPPAPDGLAGDVLRPIVDRERGSHDLVVVQAPEGAGEALTLSSSVDAAVLVVQTGETRLGELSLAVRQLNRINVPILGAILIRRRYLSGRRAADATAPTSPAPARDRAPV